jgi:hypothetical protein
MANWEEAKSITWFPGYCPSPSNPKKMYKKLDLFSLTGDEMARNLSM